MDVLYKDLYKVFRSIKQRCYNKNNKRYSDYGGRGVVVCDEWLNDYKTFIDWAIKNGYKKGLCIDKDILKGDGLLYSPERCSWVTPKENNRVKRNGKFDEYKVKCIRESNLSSSRLAELYNTSSQYIYLIRTGRIWK